MKTINKTRWMIYEPGDDARGLDADYETYRSRKELIWAYCLQAHEPNAWRQDRKSGMVKAVKVTITAEVSDGS